MIMNEGSIEVAMESCRAFKQQIRFKDQFDLLLWKIAEWVQSQEDSLSAAYITLQEAGLLLLVVLNRKNYNEALEAALTELDLEIACDDDFDLIKLSVLAIPECSDATLASFLSDKLQIRYVLHGD